MQNTSVKLNEHQDVQNIELKNISISQQQLNVAQDVIITNPIKQQSKQSYRPDIDGLRTIAVVIVVVFHAWPQTLKGGFVGVDIFFVISGYLITGIIVKQFKYQKFTYANFYKRRIKRIFPALNTVLISVGIAGCMIYMKQQLIILGQTIFYATIFSSNIYHLTYVEDYFNQFTKKNPLLHLWSLGVEEQFYFVWPFVISLAITKFKSNGFLFLIVFTIISLSLNIYETYFNENVTSFSFYFPLCRFWEMAIGGLIVYRPIKIKNIYLRNLFSLIGILGIIITVIIIDENSPFPGLWAAVPTISTALIILGGKQSIINNQLLSSKIFVFVGKISYPLYLWHWPILVFGDKLFPEGSTSIFSSHLFLVLIAFFLSLLTYFLIENPLRFNKKKRVIVLLFALMIIISLISIIIMRKSEFFSLKQRQYSEIFQTQQKEEFQQIWPSNKNQTQKQFNNKNNTHLLISQRQYLKATTQYQKSCVPKQNDFYFKNNKWIPNSSINKNRKQTSMKKIMQNRYKTAQNFGVFLQKKIQPSSIYYDEYFKNYQAFDILNQNKQNNILMIIGDSHAKIFAKRFYELYRQSIYNNNTDQFPKIIAISLASKFFIQGFQHYDYALNYIKKHKPQKILFAHRWLLYLRDIDMNPALQYNTILTKKYNKVQINRKDKPVQNSVIQLFINSIKQIQELGIQIYATIIHPQGKQFAPKNMLDEFGIIQQNLKPLKLSKFKQKFKQQIQIVQNAIKKTGINAINLTDNTCWHDFCEVLMPSGYPQMIDDNHYALTFSQYWFSALDHIAQF